MDRRAARHLARPQQTLFPNFSSFFLPEFGRSRLEQPLSTHRPEFSLRANRTTRVDMDRLFGARRVAELRNRLRPSVTGRCVEEFELAPGTRECSRRFVLAPAVSPIGRSARGDPFGWSSGSNGPVRHLAKSCYLAERDFGSGGVIVNAKFVRAGSLRTSMPKDGS
jgi:hypothetical protein